MKVKQLGEGGFDRVTRYLQGTLSAPTHWPEWNLLVSRHFKTRFFYLVAEVNGVLQGICPVHEVRKGWIVTWHSGQFHFIPYGGWIADPGSLNPSARVKISLNGRFECFAIPLEGLSEKALQGQGGSFSTLVTDLRREEDEIWSSSIDSKRRNMIRKATRAGITVDSGHSVFGDFFRIYRTAAVNNGLKYLPEEFLQEMLSLDGNVRFVPYVAYSKGKANSVLGLVHDKDYAIYWLGATDRNSESMGQGEMLQWEAMRYSRSRGCRYYDLCYIDRQRLPGIYDFKKGFSDSEVIVPYTNRKGFLYRVINKIQG